MKVLYLYENLMIGGAEQLLLTTLKYLDRKNFSPVVYCLGEKGEIAHEIEKIGIQVKNLNKKPSLLNIKLIFDLVRVFRIEKPCVLHSHLFYANYFGRIAAIFSQVPVVIITEHGTYSNFKKPYHYLLDFLLSFFTTKIIAVSNAVQTYLSRYSLIPQKKISVIYNAIDIDRFDYEYGVDKTSARKRFGFLPSDFVIGCVSNLAPWKGQLFLVMAFGSKLKATPSAKLCIVGRDRGGFKSILEDYAKKNGFFERIFFLGERRDVPQVLNILDLFVLPSLTEGLGISVIEAMYMRLPVVVSRVEGVMELIEHQKNGFLVKAGDSEALGDGILELMRNREKAKQLGINAREKVKESFLPDAYIKKVQFLYEELLRKRLVGKKVFK